MIKPWVRVVAMGILVLGTAACKVESLEIKAVDRQGKPTREVGFTISDQRGPFVSIEIGQEIPRVTYFRR